MNRDLKEFCSRNFDGNGNLFPGDPAGSSRDWNEKCPNPTCEGPNPRHCSRCREEHGIWVCGTNSKGHHVFNPKTDTMPIFRGRPRFDKGEVRHSEIHWKEMRDDEVKRVFNIYDKEIRKRGWYDARK